tara:strand:- start:2998 stop:3336 length:339 start_codon:yes stop_codon:yes gene_type:complete
VRSGFGKLGYAKKKADLAAAKQILEKDAAPTPSQSPAPPMPAGEAMKIEAARARAAGGRQRERERDGWRRAPSLPPWQGPPEAMDAKKNCDFFFGIQKEKEFQCQVQNRTRG